MSMLLRVLLLMLFSSSIAVIWDVKEAEKLACDEAEQFLKKINIITTSPVKSPGLIEVLRQINNFEANYAQYLTITMDIISNIGRQNSALSAKISLVTKHIKLVSMRYQQMQTYTKIWDNLEMSTLIDFAEWTVNPNAHSVNTLMADLHMTLTGNSNGNKNMLLDLLHNYEHETMKDDEQCPQQFIYTLYKDISVTELKAYTMTQFAWMILRTYGKGNFSMEADLLRHNYERRLKDRVALFSNVMEDADRNVWRCDPSKGHKATVSYDEVTRLLQGFIVNEVDLNTEQSCFQDCQYYETARVEHCYYGETEYCGRQDKCSGRIYNCQYVDSYMTVCPATHSNNRRYEYIEYENGRFLGERKECVGATSRVESWWRWIFWHCSYCFCLCDEQSMKSDRFFNLRESVSDIKANKVVTGLRFVKRNRVFHLQIQEGQLVPRGGINESTLVWKPVQNYKIFDRNVVRGEDYHTLSYESSSIDLDDIQSHDNRQVVTGVRFRAIGGHLNLEVRFSEYDFKKGILINKSSLKSQHNVNRKKLELKDLDIPSRTLARSLPISEHNQYIDFSVSGMDQDASQSTIPFIDIQDVTSNPPVPLAGIGIYYKASPGYGGFLAPKIITYNFTPHVRTP